MQAYSDPTRENDPHALPDVEVFEISAQQEREFLKSRSVKLGADLVGIAWQRGWYWWFCFPGCMPDGEPNGPFATEAEALADAQSSSATDCTCDNRPDVACSVHGID